MKLLETYRAWRVSREELVITKAVLLGADIHPFISSNDARYGVIHDRPLRYRVYVPIHGGMGELTIYHRTVYGCAKKFLALQELT